MIMRQWMRQVGGGMADPAGTMIGVLGEASGHRWCVWLVCLLSWRTRHRAVLPVAKEELRAGLGDRKVTSAWCSCW